MHVRVGREDFQILPPLRSSGLPLKGEGGVISLRVTGKEIHIRGNRVPVCVRRGGGGQAAVGSSYSPPHACPGRVRGRAHCSHWPHHKTERSRLSVAHDCTLALGSTTPRIRAPKPLRPPSRRRPPGATRGKLLHTPHPLKVASHCASNKRAVWQRSASRRRCWLARMGYCPMCKGLRLPRHVTAPPDMCEVLGRCRRHIPKTPRPHPRHLCLPAAAALQGPARLRSWRSPELGPHCHGQVDLVP